MKAWSCLGGLLLACCAAAGAATPTYSLSCVPDSSDLSLIEQMRMRLDLHGWREVSAGANYHLCFRMNTRQQVVNGAPAGGAYPYGAYWNAPMPQIITLSVLELTVARPDGPAWQAQQDLPQDLPAAQGLEQAVHLLIDRLPLE